MKKRMFYGTRILFFCLLIGGTGIINGYAQDSEQTLRTLRDKYNWGSIYLTYDTIVDFCYILNSVKKDKIKAENGDAHFLLYNFLITNKNPNINQSIAVVEIDLNRVQAGFTRANDTGGTIRQIPWSREEVIRVANLSDKILVGAYQARAVLKDFNNNEVAAAVSIKEAADIVKSIYDSPYISSEDAALALFGFRTLIEKKPEEFAKLKFTDQELYNSVAEFKTSFDNSLPKKEIQEFQTNKKFSDSYLQNLGEKSNTATLQKLESSSASIVRLNDSKVNETPILNSPILKPMTTTTTATVETSKVIDDPGFYSKSTDKPSDKPFGAFLGGITGSRRTEIIGSTLKTSNITGKVKEKIDVGEFSLTVVNVEKSKEISESVKARSGKIFLSVEIIIEGNLDFTVPISPLFTRIKDSQNYEYKNLEAGKEPSLKPQFVLPAGEKARGWLTFEVPEEGKDFILIYQSSSPLTRLSVTLGQ